MKTHPILLFPISCASLAMLSLTAFAQRPEGGGEGRPEGPRGEGRGFMRFVPPVMAALDTDKNGELSEEEIKNAPAALKTLDKNSDGKVSAEEMRPPMPREGEGRPGAGGNPEEMVTRLMAMDKNGDGKLTKDELSERMAGMLTRGDTDKDGALSKEEIRALAGRAGGERREGGEGRERREGGERGEREREGGEGRRRPEAEGDRPVPPAPPAPPAPPVPPAPPAPPK